MADKAKVDLQIRGVPVGLQRRIRAKAARKSMSMSKYVIQILEDNIDEPNTINDWLDEHPRRVVHDKLREKFNIDPSTDKLQRYDQKRLRARALAETTELKVDVHDFLALSNGQPTRFDEASLILIQKRVLELAADPKTKPGLLKDLFRIATYADRKAWVDHRKEINTARLALDNRKQDLREKQFDHQKSIDEKKFAEPEPPKKLTPQEKQEKLWDIFCLSEEERARRRAKAGSAAPSSPSSTNGSLSGSAGS